MNGYKFLLLTTSNPDVALIAILSPRQPNFSSNSTRASVDTSGCLAPSWCHEWAKRSKARSPPGPRLSLESSYILR